MVVATTGATLEEGSYKSGMALDWMGSLIDSVCTSFDCGSGSERCGGRDKGGCRRSRVSSTAAGRAGGRKREIGGWIRMGYLGCGDGGEQWRWT